jgi:hypothetical protein
MTRRFGTESTQTRASSVGIVDAVGGGFIPTQGQGGGARARVPGRGRRR